MRAAGKSTYDTIDGLVFYRWVPRVIDDDDQGGLYTLGIGITHQ
jgi:hypothetical protein